MASKTADEIEGHIRAILARDAKAAEDFERSLCGGLPPWLPEATCKRVREIYSDSRALGFTDRQLLSMVRRCESPRFQIPGLAPDGVKFLGDLYFLRGVAYAVSLEPERGLAVLAGEFAAYGWRRREKEKPFHESKAGRAQTQSRAPAWERWRTEARAIRARNPSLSLSEIARRVKKGLRAQESEHTIRRRIRDI